MRNDNLRVSVGMPVFNGENYLEEAIQSILGQTYADFELIISDNASTDMTPKICQDYAARDRRIRYYRNEKNLGAANNFNRVFQLSQGEYFKWAAHDDVIDPDFLIKCIKVLDRDPSIVLCNSKTKFLDESGKLRRNYDIMLINAASPKPHVRFRDLVLIDHLCTDIFGLMRRSALRMTSLFGGYTASDRVLLAELALRGRFYEIPEYLFFLREHPKQSTKAIPFHLRAAFFDPAKEGRIVFPHWRVYVEYFKSLSRVSLTRRERAYCYLHLLHWWGVNLNWARMMTDPVIGFIPGSLNLFLKFKNWYYKDKN